MNSLSHRQESLLRALYTRHGRKKSPFCISEGIRPCVEIVNYAPDIIEFAVCREDFDSTQIQRELIPVPAKLFDSLSSLQSSQGLIFVVRKPETEGVALPPPISPFIVVLDKLGDPGNFGTILRTARSAGLRDIWYTKGSVDPFNEKVIRAATASQFLMNLRAFPDLQSLKTCLDEWSYNKIFRTDPHEGLSCFKAENLFSKSAVIFGSEAHGASSLADSVPLTIPMPGGVESLNVAQAATIILFEYVRRQQL